MKVAHHRWLVLLVLFSILINVVWFFMVGFIRDDAFITFRFAHNLSNGLGFVFNPGEQVYGSSSPGFALLMAAWLTLFPDQPVVGAVLFDITASALSLIFLWKLLEDLRLTDLQRALVLFVLVWSDKLLLHSMEGMETPLVVTCMLASVYFLLRSRPVLAGITAGLMLWLRLDSAIWIGVLAIIVSPRLHKSMLIFLVISILIYFPWLLFAWQTYDTFVPHTAIAKHVAYAVNAPPWPTRLHMFAWMTPVSLLIHPYLVKIGAAFTYALALYGAWHYSGSRVVQVLAIFFVLQSAALIILNMTVEQRYYLTSLYSLLILFGLGLTQLRIPGPARVTLFITYVVISFALAFPRMQQLAWRAEYVNTTLTNVGTWLHDNTPARSTVFLEPLGFTGYYADRRMLDAVGLITPAVTSLHQERISSFEIERIMNADYVVLHCDDAKNAPKDYPYTHVMARFDPLDFLSGRVWQNDAAIQRSACYVINSQ